MTKTIVLIDDAQDLRDVLSLLLGEEGFQVLTAADGKSGLQLAIDTHPDLVLTDFAMPGMNGGEVACSLRQQPQLSALQIVIMSAHLESEVCKVFSGYDAFCSKAQPPEMLLRTVARLLGHVRKSGR